MGDDDGERVTAATTKMPPPSSSSVRPIPPVPVFPPYSQPPSSHGVRVAVGRGSQLVPPTQDEEASSAHRSRENKLEVSRGKRKY